MTPRRPLQLLLVLLLLALASGCARFTAISPEEAFEREPAAVELTDVPYYPQEAYQCGPAALAEMLTWDGYPITAEELKDDLYIPEREGTLQTEIIAQTRARERVPYQIPGTFDAIIDELEAGNPVMVFQNLGLGWLPVWHFAVVVGYDPDQAEFILRSGTEERHISSLDTFRREWDGGERWAIVVTGPDTLPATAEPTPWLRAALDLEQTGRTDAARTAYTTGSSRWPEEPGFHLGLVNLHHAQGDLEQAEAAARKGLDEADRLRGVLYNNLAMVLLKQERLDEAEEAAESALAIGGDYEDNFRETLNTVRCHRAPDCDPDANGES